MKNPAKILVVDDQSINVRMLEHKLENIGMEVYTASNGKECLQKVKETHPDIILLDIMMPEMDGIETCKHLKADPKTESIPIIFITVKSNKESKLEGLEIGAYDYITKPIDLDETIARIHTQLRIQSTHNENIKLHQRLAEAKRDATVGAVTQGIAHNLNNLLGVAMGYLDLLKMNPQDSQKVEKNSELIQQALSRIAGIIRQLSTMAARNQQTYEPTQLESLLKNTIKRFKEENDISENIQLTNNTPKNFTINTNAETFETSICKLLMNAWESYPESHTGSKDISVDAQLDNQASTERLVIKINDRGNGIADEVKDTLFEPFVSSKAAVGCGLGLTMARHAIRTQGGDISLSANKNGGTCATITHTLEDSTNN